MIRQLEGLEKKIKPSQLDAVESEAEDELEQLLELARCQYEQNPLSDFSSTRFSDDDELITEINVVCPYCDYIFTATEGGVECPLIAIGILTLMMMAMSFQVVKGSLGYTSAIPRLYLIEWFQLIPWHSKVCINNDANALQFEPVQWHHHPLARLT